MSRNDKKSLDNRKNDSTSKKKNLHINDIKIVRNMENDIESRNERKMRERWKTTWTREMTKNVLTKTKQEYENDLHNGPKLKRIVKMTRT